MTRISERLGVLITGCLSVMPYALSRVVFAPVLLFLIEFQTGELAGICRMSYIVCRMSLIVSGKAGTICQNLMPQNLHDTSSQPDLDSLLDFLV